MARLKFQDVQAWMDREGIGPAEAARRLGVSTQRFNGWKGRQQVSADSTDAVKMVICAERDPSPTPARDVALAAGPVSASETRRVQQREGGWIGAKMTPAQQSLLRAVELMGRTIPDERAKALAELVLLSGGPVEAPPKVTA